MPLFEVTLTAATSFAVEADTPEQAQEISRSLVNCGDFSMLDGEAEPIAPDAAARVRARVDHDLCEDAEFAAKGGAA